MDSASGCGIAHLGPVESVLMETDSSEIRIQSVEDLPENVCFPVNGLKAQSLSMDHQDELPLDGMSSECSSSVVIQSWDRVVRLFDWANGSNVAVALEHDYCQSTGDAGADPLCDVEGEIVFAVLEDDAEDFDAIIYSYQEEFRESSSDGLHSLRHMILDAGISVTQGTKILQYLSDRYPSDNYPRTYQTLMGTPRKKIATQTMGDGQYAHYGIAQGLARYNRNVVDIIEKMGSLEIDIGIDGFQLSKSSKKSGWPIIGAVVGVKVDPVVFGLWVGKTKPSLVDEFLLPFCEEMDDLRRNRGLIITFSVLA